MSQSTIINRISSYNQDLPTLVSALVELVNYVFSINTIQSVNLPTYIASNLPQAKPSNDGLVVVDQTNGRLVYYANGKRYYIAGTAF